MCERARNSFDDKRQLLLVFLYRNNYIAALQISQKQSDYVQHVSKMKKLKHKSYIRHLRKIRARKKKDKKERKKTLKKLVQKKQRKLNALQKRIVAPTHIQIGGKNNAIALIQCIKDTSDYVLKHKQQVALDFTRTETIRAEGMILLYAELDRIIACAKIEKPISTIPPQQQKPHEVLQQVGFYSLVGEHHDVAPCMDDVVHWKKFRGSDQNGENLAELENIGIDPEKIKTIWRGVTEAINNSVEHAYAIPRELDGFQGNHMRWWMFTHITDKEAIFVVCDLGCGYKNTINNTIGIKIANQIKAALRLKANIDSQSIAVAMEYGRTATNKFERGKGSKDALSIISRNKSGRLAIYSNKGYVMYEKKEQDNKNRTTFKPKQKKLDCSINGTIVWWSFPLNDKL